MTFDKKIMIGAGLAVGGSMVVMVVLTLIFGPRYEVKPAIESAETPGPVDMWMIREGRSSMDDSPQVTLSLIAENEVQGWLQSQFPVLYVRCKEGRIDTFIETGLSTNPELGRYDEYTVRLRFDNGKPIIQRWSESTDNKALFAPNGLSAARMIAKADRMLFEFTPFNARPAIAEFKVAGLASKLDKVTAACGKPGRRGGK